MDDDYPTQRESTDKHVIYRPAVLVRPEGVMVHDDKVDKHEEPPTIGSHVETKY